MVADFSAEAKPLMRVREVASLFDVDPETVRVWVREGKLRARKTPGGRVLVFRRVDVFALLNDTEDLSSQNENGPALATATPGEPLTAPLP